MNMQYEKSVRGRFFPQPRNLSLKDGFRLLDDAVPVEISGHSGETMIVEAFVKYWNAGAVMRQTGNTLGDLMDAYADIPFDGICMDEPIPHNLTRPNFWGHIKPLLSFLWNV